IKNEADNGLRNTRGTIAMARTADKDSATSQFFINVADNAFLDLNGVNSEERVPMTIAASPFFAFSHAERRSLSFSPECSTSTGA
ncbi:peptidylprolyl isomerase, partial [Salmonella enterica subsp. enterica serovar Montevideo]|nr:peptidylprolyl isomerase [Salmonella enterica subsp. enterica serovar Montevideo]